MKNSNIIKFKDNRDRKTTRKRYYNNISKINKYKRKKKRHALYDKYENGIVIFEIAILTILILGISIIGLGFLLNYLF